ncbi:hypothetical protein DFJ74DRAFT_662968 [Hyaloraphidium curvatum]|nr:hypothetical protein DFJ74DRAFT_662968 [Hyaloraphidium curvatum]
MPASAPPPGQGRPLETLLEDESWLPIAAAASLERLSDYALDLADLIRTQYDFVPDRTRWRSDCPPAAEGLLESVVQAAERARATADEARAALRDTEEAFLYEADALEYLRREEDPGRTVKVPAEALRAIGGFLEWGDALELSLVCKEFHSLMIPRIMETCTVHDASGLLCLLRDSQIKRSGTPRQAWISSLTLEPACFGAGPDLVAKLLSMCSSLRELDYLPASWADLGALGSVPSELERLVIQFYRDPPCDRVPNFELPRTDRIVYYGPTHAAFLDRIPEACPGLRSFVYQGGGGPTGPTDLLRNAPAFILERMSAFFVEDTETLFCLSEDFLENESFRPQTVVCGLVHGSVLWNIIDRLDFIRNVVIDVLIDDEDTFIPETFPRSLERVAIDHVFVPPPSADHVNCARYILRCLGTEFTVGSVAATGNPIFRDELSSMGSWERRWLLRDWGELEDLWME